MSKRTFVPYQLFANNEQGAWYDPSDFSTLYQTSTGTTPVTAVEQPVGLMLDKSQGLVLGSELMGLATPGTANVVKSGNQFICATTASWIELNLPATGLYAVSISCTAQCVIYQDAGNSTVANTFTGGNFSYIVRLQSNARIYLLNPPNTIVSLSIKLLPGNHALQATSASRPVLRARYNQLTYSEQFDNAGWSKIALTVTADATAAPDGTTTADKLAETSANSTHDARQTFTLAASTTYALSAFFKSSERTSAALAVFGVAMTGTTGVHINLTTGAIGTIGGNLAPVSSFAVQLANGWWRLTIIITTNGTGGGATLRVGSSDGTTNESYVGTSGSGVFCWGAQLLTAADQTATGGAYQRIAAATDYDTSNPVFRPYLAFDGVDDFMSLASAISITTDMTVVRGFGRSAGGINAVGLNTIAGGPGDFVWFGSDNGRANEMNNFVLTAAVSTASGSFVTSSRRNATTQSLRQNGANVALNLTTAGTATNSVSVLGRRSTLYNNGPIYGLIVLDRELTGSELTATEQWMAGKTGVPSLQLLYDATDYLNGIAPYHWFDFVNDRALYASTDVGAVSGATGYSFSRASAGYYTNADGTLTSFASGELRRGDRGVLIEGARTNTFLQSQTIDNASWTKTGGSASANSVAAPDGTTTADLFTENSATSEHFVRQSVTLAAGYTVTFSAFVKFNGRRYVALRVSDVAAHAAEAVFDLTGGVVGVTGVTVGTPTVVGSSLTALANGWFRISFTLTMPGGSTSSARCDLCHVSSNATGSTSFTGDGASGTYIWGAQLEAASFPSSYIPTTTASATRAADVLTCTAGVGYPLSLWAEFERAVDTGVGEIIAQIDAGADANRLGIYVTSIDRPQAFVSSSGATQADITIASTIAINTAVKMAARCATNSVNLAYNGTAGTEDTSVTAPSSPTLLRFGSGPASAFPSFGYLRRAAIFNSALSDANLQSTTSG